MKIRVAGVDHFDSMFSHKDGDMQVRDEIAGQLWNLLDDLCTNIVVQLGLRQNVEARRNDQCLDELPRVFHRPWIG